MSKDGIKLGRRSKKFKQNLNNVVMNNANGNGHMSVNETSNGSSNSNSSNQAIAHKQNGNTTINSDTGVELKRTLTSLSTSSTSSSTSSSSSSILSPPLSLPESASFNKDNKNSQQQYIFYVHDNKLVLKVADNNNATLNNEPLNSNGSAGCGALTNKTSGFIVLNSSALTATTVNNGSASIIDNSVSSTANRSFDQAEQAKRTCSSLTESSVLNLIESVVHASQETLSFYELQADSQVRYAAAKAALSSKVIYTENSIQLNAKFGMGLQSMLVESKFLEHMNTLIESTVLFAKNVPFFMNVHETDRITLLKSCVFEIICVMHAQFYVDAANDSDKLNNLGKNSSSHGTSEHSSSITQALATLADCALATSASTTVYTEKFIVPLCDLIASKEWLCDVFPMLKDFIFFLFDFFHHFSLMQLNEVEIAIFCSYLLFSSSKLQFFFLI
jgi:hypothetical protein